MEWRICYDEVNQIISGNRESSVAPTSMSNVHRKFVSNITKGQDELNSNNLKKLCRYLHYIPYDIFYKINLLKCHEHRVYDTVKNPI